MVLDAAGVIPAVGIVQHRRPSRLAETRPAKPGVFGKPGDVAVFPEEGVDDRQPSDIQLSVREIGEKRLRILRS